MNGGPLVVVGDALLDVDVEGYVERLSPDAPVPVLDEGVEIARPGGAGLAAVLVAGDGRPVTLITALARDRAGDQLRSLLTARGIDVVDLGLQGATPEKVRFRAGERSLMRLDRGGDAGSVGPVGDGAREAIDDAAGVLVSDYGRGVSAERRLRDLVAAAAERIPVTWDPHPRGPAPPPGLALATPNERELRRFEETPATDLDADFRRALSLRARWAVDALCVTRGAAGATLVRDGHPPLVAPAPAVRGGDPCGAGDRFASRAASRLADGWRLDDAMVDAVACASSFVAAGGARSLHDGPPAADRDAPADGAALARRVRQQGGTVVATGGCFDLLHAGHVRTLEAARRLGDALVVCLNSDSSIARLKGADRPLVPQEDRAAVLAALGCVDAVVVFDEDTPERVLEEIRPHVWVKGGDYDGATLPEERALRRWGGRAVLVPYVEGRSTTRLIEEAASRV
jgi:D-beta-D-heptose 7-phosphate kinase/D-beta-D-heptose 1-phosphate adenosyltransferase